VSVFGGGFGGGVVFVGGGLIGEDGGRGAGIGGKKPCIVSCLQVGWGARCLILELRCLEGGRV